MDRTSLSRATESSDAPTPGYLYVDIARAAASSPMACRETAQYLVRRLQTKSNHNIKYKCLKVIQKVSENSNTRGMFQREICQDPSAVSAIKEALQFRGGKPDPVRGDEIYARVREAAKECLDAIYSEPTSSEGMGAMSSQNAGLAAAMGGGGSGMASGGMSSSYGKPVAGYQGGGGGSGVYGSSGGGYSGGGGGGGGGPRKMEGIGNPMFADPRLESNKKGIGSMTIGAVASAVGETVVGMIKDPLAKNVGPPRNHSMPSVNVSYGGGGGPARGGYGGYGSSSPPGANALRTSTGGQWTMASNRGPNAVMPPPSTNAPSFNSNADATPRPTYSGVGGSWATSTPPLSTASHLASGAGTAASDGTYEKNLVAELCPPGGTKAEPPPDRLANFLRAVPSLDSDLVCPALLDALEDGQPWLIKAKALCVIEATLTRTDEASSKTYSDFFHACAVEIEPLAIHNRAAVAEPARRVLTALGLSAPAKPPKEAPPPPPPPQVQAAPPAPPQPEPPINLLDFGDSPSPASAPEPAPAPASSSTGGAFFGGLQVAAPPTTAPPPPPTTSVPNSGGGGGMFDNLTVNSAPTTSAPAPTETTEVPAKTDTGGGSAFGFISAAPVSAPAPAPTPSATDELLSLGVGTPTGTANATRPVMTSKPSFDPLMSQMPGGVSANAPMNPQISQAMAYQQNMMMMQQQMQQMQMALAMQQQKPQSNGGAIMGANMMRTNFIPEVGMGMSGGGKKMQQFSILENAKKHEQEKKFDFIQDAMKGAK